MLWFGVFLRSFLGSFYMQWDVLCTMQWDYAKTLHLLAQNYQSYPTFENKQPVFADKAADSLQNRSKLTFQPVTVCSKLVFLEQESNKNHTKLANVEYVALQGSFGAVTSNDPMHNVLLPSFYAIGGNRKAMEARRVQMAAHRFAFYHASQEEENWQNKRICFNIMCDTTMTAFLSTEVR